MNHKIILKKWLIKWFNISPAKQRSTTVQTCEYHGDTQRAPLTSGCRVMTVIDLGKLWYTFDTNLDFFVIRLRHEVTDSSEFGLILVTFLIWRGWRVTGLASPRFLTLKEGKEAVKAKLLRYSESLGGQNSHLGITRARVTVRVRLQILQAATTGFDLA
jgi:hypothetical protein